MTDQKLFNATVLFYPRGNPKLRFFALWYFVILLIAWTVLGHTVLGFEQSWAAPVVATLYAMLLHLLLECVDASAKHRKLRFSDTGSFLTFLTPAIIPGIACAMLLYANERLWPILFAVTVAIGSKVLFRAPIGNARFQHIFNPSNLGVALTLVLFPTVGFAPPYHFTENLYGAWNWLLPVFVLITGIIIHSLFTGRLPLVAAWIIGFALQGTIRALMSGTPLIVPIMPMTSAAFIVFTLYMVPDPATTPLKPSRQVLFGFAIALVYGIIQMMHLVFGLFFALVIVCGIRGVMLHTTALMARYRPAPESAAGERIEDDVALTPQVQLNK